ncbi:hypothetical protein [Piscinibacter koreensis]|uniref:Uncharacterized protein n=1 Tax=Piscinibacter koreensis TaxID=2742824 RepID=A0A7Y6NTT4_9BURK|nr:hypothetical protein [Schlegelella koreensis]NUZ09067.1 hypothetical protein [Schlegelella koreensis]
MIEIAGLLLAVVGIVFAFDTPRRYLVGLFSGGSPEKDVRAGSSMPVVDICHRGISVEEVGTWRLRFDIPYCAGKNANAHNVKLQSAVLRVDGQNIERLSAFGDDFPDGISLTYETGKSITYTLSPLDAAAIAYLYIAVRGSYTAESGDKVFPVLDIFKFNSLTKSWVRTLGDEDNRIRAFVRAEP